MENYLVMNNISKTFAGNTVLHNVDFNLNLGEVRALMGENGAGKSTLMKILGGIYQKDKDSGDISINGQTIQIESVKDAKAHGIAIVHQEISLVREMTVFDNLYMGNEIVKKSKFLNDKEMIKRSQTIIDDFKLNINVRQKVKELSIAQQQMVEICRALLFDAKILVMDEPTSSLTERETEELFARITALKDAGLAIVYISHRMDEIFRICDSISVLRDGHYIGTEQIKDVDQDHIIKMMVGRNIGKYSKRASGKGGNSTCLSVEKLTNDYIKDVTFDLKEGEVLGFAGLVGAGRTETARAIFGIDKIKQGTINLMGKQVVIDSVDKAIKLGIGYVPENRKEDGLILDNTVSFNLTISILDKFLGKLRLNKKKEQGIINEYSNKLSIKMASPSQMIRYLSGGNQQKVVLSKWLATNPKILILDEPTRGIDIGAKTEIYKLIENMANENVSVILISSEMEEIISLSNRIVVMYEGKVTAVLNEEETSKVTQEEIMWYASGRVKNEESNN